MSEKIQKYDNSSHTSESLNRKMPRLNFIAGVGSVVVAGMVGSNQIKNNSYLPELRGPGLAVPSRLQESVALTPRVS